MKTKPEYLTIKEVSELLEVTPTTLRNWDKSKKLVAHRNPVNGYRLYSVEDVTAILRDRDENYQTDGSHAAPNQTDVQTFLFPSLFSKSESKQDTRTLRLLVRQMSKAFRDSMGGGLLERFEEISKILYCKLYDERQSQTQDNYKRQFYFSAHDPLNKTYQRIGELYENAISLLPNVFTNSQRELSKDEKAVVRIVELLHPVNLGDIPADIKGTVYEELVRNTFEKSDNQQFFTPRSVVQFMVRFINPQLGQTLCDPACGSGGFLIEASKHIGHLLCSQAEEEFSTNHIVQYLSKHIIGLEIDRRMAWVAQMNLIMHGDGHGSIHHLDNNGSLGFSDNLNHLVRPDSLDLVLTNPPFGSDFSDKEHLPKYQLGEGKSSRRRGILFIERCIGWLKPGGRLGVVIEDSVLNGASNKDVRRLVFQHCIVEAVISLPDVTFMPYASAKTSILFLRKKADNREVQSDIFMANVEQIGRKPNGDPLYIGQQVKDGRRELLNELPDVVDAWQTYAIGSEEAITHLSPKIFICPSERFMDGTGIRLDVQFHHPSRKIAEDTLNRSIYPTPKLAELITVRNVMVTPSAQDPDEVCQYVGLANIAATTGEYTVSNVLGSQIKSGVRLFRPGDILFSKLRPELRKCVLIRDDEDEGYVSSECLVFCTLADASDAPLLKDIASKRKSSKQYQVDREYLAFILRSDIVFGQLVYQITGVGRPRVSQSAVLGLRIPLPPLSVQREIVAAYKMAWKHHLECRTRSETALREGNEALEAAYNHASDQLCPTPKKTI